MVTEKGREEKIQCYAVTNKHLLLHFESMIITKQKSGPQVARMLQTSCARRDKQQQELISPNHLLGLAKGPSAYSVNFIPAVAYHLCLPAAFTQPGNHLSAEPL